MKRLGRYLFGLRDMPLTNSWQCISAQVLGKDMKDTTH